MNEPLPHDYGQIDEAYGLRCWTISEAEDGPVWMVNLMAYRPKAIYDGKEAEIDGRTADNLYNPTDVLTKIGADMCFVGDVIEQGEGTRPGWDRIAVVKYLTRKSFVEMAARPDFREKHKHKHAGMAQTIVSCCIPLAGFSPLMSADIPAGANPDRVVALHILRFDPQAGEQVQDYLVAAAERARANGGSIEAMMTVEGTFIGDGRGWDGVLMVAYPSQDAYTASGLAQADSAFAIVDRYDLVTKPLIDHLRATQDGVSAAAACPVA